jgi:hypothetical protein
MTAIRATMMPYSTIVAPRSLVTKPLGAVLSYSTMWMLLSYVDPVRVSSTGCTMAKTKPAVIDGIDEPRLQGPVLAGAVGPSPRAYMFHMGGSGGSVAAASWESGLLESTSGWVSR